MLDAYLRQVDIILLHVDKMVSNQKLYSLHIVLVLIPTLNQTSARQDGKKVV